MALSLSKRVWVLAERLFIHCYKADGFVRLLRQHDIDYEGARYETFDKTKGLYTFMSEEDFDFARFMELVPSYKYLPLLREIVFDAKVRKTAVDHWNYYGEYIKNWYPDLIDLLNLAGVEVDYEKETLTHPEPPPTPEPRDFLPDEFGDLFIDYIRKEANECRRSGLFLSLMFLSRKVLEVVTVRVLEVVFPKFVGGKYSEHNHVIWYDTERGRYHSFDTLLNNLKENSEAFHEDEELVKEYMSLVRPFKNETNKHVHLDYQIPDERYINEWRIPRLIGMARRLYRKYCNP